MPFDVGEIDAVGLSVKSQLDFQLFLRKKESLGFLRSLTSRVRCNDDASSS